MIIEVEKADLSNVIARAAAPAPLEDGQARIRIDAFALTSNNITYAVFGDAMRYWEFFPVAGDGSAVRGQIPVWGIGEVVESLSEDCGVGERLYGFYPMASELVITTGRADERGLTDIAAHRAPMAGAYNRYVRCERDPIYRADRERHQMLFYPLFFTSFLVDDFFDDADDFEAQQLIVSSASSKTAIGVAFMARRRGCRVIGITSAGNKEFVESLDTYDKVVCYDEIADLERSPSVFIDIAGNRDVLHAVHARMDGVLVYSMAVGGTHWDHKAEVRDDLAKPEPVFFFAPAQISKRSKEWGIGALDVRIAGAWDEYASWVDSWIDFRSVTGPDEVIDAYLELLRGSLDPKSGCIASV